MRQLPVLRHVLAGLAVVATLAATAVPAAAAAPTATSIAPSTVMPASTLAAAPASLARTLVESFDAGAGGWTVSAAGVISASANATQGTGSLALRYNLSVASQAIISPLTSAHAPELPGLPRSLSIDVLGDKSWNVVYLQVRDATGEIFHYRLGNLDFSGWRTMSVDLGSAAPAATLFGNGDGVLDLPLQPYRIIVDRNPGATTFVSTVAFDNLVYTYEDGSPFRASPSIFVPSAGQAATLSVAPVEPADASVTLTDEGGRTRTFSGSAAGGGAVLSWAWNGKAGDGSTMTGSVRGRLVLARGNTKWTYGIPYLAGLPARYESSAPGSIAGINARLSEINTSARSQAQYQARLMEGAFLRWDRESFDWNQTEPRQGWFEWAKLDQTVNVARAHHVDILGRLEYSALWASSAPAGTASGTAVLYPPKSVSAFAAYARAVVHRYKDRVHTWEIWNEENSSRFWRSGVSASGYAALLKAAYAAIKAEDPTATVVLGGTVGFDQKFMNGLVAAGAWGSFDALAIHAYVVPGPEKSMFDTWLENAKAYVDTHGTKPIYITEFGWSTYAGSGSSYIGATEAAQATYLARAYLHAALKGVRGVFPYELIEHGTGTTSILNNYGIVETSGRAKPAYAAIRRVAEALDGGVVLGAASPTAATRKVIDPLDAVGSWKSYPLGGGSASLATSTTHHGGTASLRLAYKFTSTSSGVELKRSIAVAGRPTSLALWAYGDASANPVYLKFTDATGEVYQAYIGALQKGWQRLVLHMDGSDINWKHSGGDNDGVVDYPITVRSIFVFRAGIGKLSGTVLFDDIEAQTGAKVRGVVIARRGGIDQAIYSLGGTVTATVPVTGAAAYRVDGTTVTQLAVTGGAVTVSVGSQPVNILTGPGLDVPSITPNGDGIADSASVRIVAGDRAALTAQVVNAAGSVVRTLGSGIAFDAGVRSVTWDGTVGGAKAPAGTYRVRLVVVGPDGRSTILERSVKIA